MPLGEDQQYDETLKEQDKIRRRRELRARLKLENVNRKYNPFFHMKDVTYQDPAIDRYMDLRKHGRMPGSPWKPSKYFGTWLLIIGPIFVISKVVEWERKDWLQKVSSGEISYKERQGKTLI